ncbi:CotH kinase family protein, partial [Butyrivibrio sp. AE3009]|uniref:CotH kinase family protein n=1 Tax=Butyrivibrio sp. AE3009 TaxID=1280666 RepID=UPI000479EDD8
KVEESKVEESKVEEPKVEESRKEEPKKGEPKKEATVKTATAKSAKELKEEKKAAKKAEKEAKLEARQIARDIKKSRQEAEQMDPEAKKKATMKDWVIICLSVLSLLLLIFIVYTTRTHDKQISERLINDSKKDNLTVVSEKAAIDSVRISEVNAEGWIELYNEGSDIADISGAMMYISGKKAAVIADETTIAATGYLVFNIGKNPGASDYNVMSLTDKEGKLLDSMIIPKLSGSSSYGVTNNVNYNIGYMEATKGTDNVEELTEEEYSYVEGIGFSTPGGFYDSAFSLSLSAKSGEKIYYTTDGTEPTTESTEYTGAFTISNKSGRKYVYSRLGFGYLNKTGYNPYTVDAGMIVRAITVDGSGKVTGSAIQEYFIGFANDSAYADIPVISLTANPEDLFDYFNGIYVPGRAREDAIISGEDSPNSYANYLNGWERNGQVAFYETTKDKTLVKNGTVKIYSDVEIGARQKGLELNVGDPSEFAGSSIMDYIGKDGSLILQTYIDDQTLKAKDFFVSRILKDSKVGTLDMSPCYLFIDGEFWGVYLMKAPLNANYFVRNYDVKGDVIVRQRAAYQANFVNMYNFITENDMSVAENYNKAKTMMDMDNYIEYVCARVYIGYTGPGTTKGTMWRTVDSGGTGYNDGRWRWIMNYPIGNSMGNASNRTASIDTLMHGPLRMDKLFQSLLMNKEFCKQLEDTMNSMATERFSTENVNTVLDEVSELMRKPAVETYKRFTGSYKEAQYKTDIDFIRSYFENRPDYITFYAKELAEKGGDLEYIREMELLGATDDADDEDQEESEEEGEENLENSEEDADNTDTDSVTGDAAQDVGEQTSTEEQGVETNDGQ